MPKITNKNNNVNIGSWGLIIVIAVGLLAGIIIYAYINFTFKGIDDAGNKQIINLPDQNKEFNNNLIEENNHRNVIPIPNDDNRESSNKGILQNTRKIIVPN